MVSSAGPGSPASAIVSVGMSRRRAVQPSRAPITSARAGIVARAVRWVTAGDRKPASKTPSRTAGSGSLGASDGATEISATAHTAAPIAIRLQRATAWASAAHAANNPMSAPTPAQIAITTTGFTSATWAVRAGCMVSGTTTAAPIAAGKASANSAPTPGVGANEDQRRSKAAPVRAPTTAASIGIQATHASWAVH